MTYPDAYVTTGPNGELVLVDPAAEGMIAAVEAHNLKIAKRNCQTFFEQQKDRVEHFIGRMKARNLTQKDVVIVLVDVDDPSGGPLAKLLMPDTPPEHWQQFRDKGQVPIARGLAIRDGLQEFVDLLDPGEAGTLRRLCVLDIGVVVVAYNTCRVFEVRVPI